MSRSLFDKYHGGYRVFIGNVNSRIGKVELEQEFEHNGDIVDAWVARNPPGFAFLVFKTADEADKAVRRMDGVMLFGRKVRVEHANAAFKPAGWDKNGVGPPAGRRQRSRSPRRRSPPTSRRSRSPMTSRRSRSPKPSRRSRSPMTSRRNHSPITSRRSRSPITSRRSRSPITSRRSRSPITSRRSRSPITSRRSRSPITSRRSKSPITSRRSGSLKATRSPVIPPSPSRLSVSPARLGRSPPTSISPVKSSPNRSPAHRFSRSSGDNRNGRLNGGRDDSLSPRRFSRSPPARIGRGRSRSLS